MISDTYTPKPSIYRTNVKWLKKSMKTFQYTLQCCDWLKSARKVCYWLLIHVKVFKTYNVLQLWISFEKISNSIYFVSTPNILLSWQHLFIVAHYTGYSQIMNSSCTLRLPRPNYHNKRGSHVVYIVKRWKKPHCIFLHNNKQDFGSFSAFYVFLSCIRY